LELAKQARAIANAMNDPVSKQHVLEIAVPVYSEFLADQEPLGREFEQVLHANLWDLYVRS
jgi:hypothetical protein